MDDEELSAVSRRNNEAVIRAFYAAFDEPGWEEAVATWLHEDIVWHVTGNNPLAGDFVGIQSVIAAMRQFGERSEQTLSLNTRVVIASDDEHAVAIHHATAQRGDFHYAAHEIDVFHVNEERIAEFWSFSEDQAATDTMWR